MTAKVKAFMDRYGAELERLGGPVEGVGGGLEYPDPLDFNELAVRAFARIAQALGLEYRDEVLEEWEEGRRVRRYLTEAPEIWAEWTEVGANTLDLELSPALGGDR